MAYYLNKKSDQTSTNQIAITCFSDVAPTECFVVNLADALLKYFMQKNKWDSVVRR